MVARDGQEEEEEEKESAMSMTTCRTHRCLEVEDGEAKTTVT